MHINVSRIDIFHITVIINYIHKYVPSDITVTILEQMTIPEYSYLLPTNINNTENVFCMKATFRGLSIHRAKYSTRTKRRRRKHIKNLWPSYEC